MSARDRSDGDERERGPAPETGGPRADTRRATGETRPFVDPVSGRTLPGIIGRYRLVGRIGAGGMGTVFEAEQDRPRRTVALKVLHTGALTADVLRRFELEAQVLGRLQHPGIAQILEADVFETPTGPQHFFAMERIRGKPLIDYANEHALSTDGRMELFAKICDAVAHAHARGVIHRDLKPGNILVDEAGQPKVLDFGIARVTDADVRTATLQTNVGQIVGTIPYMSPEQASGDPSTIDARTDVYTLGVVAYELLSGQMPYDAGGRLVHEALRVVREEEARPLGTTNRLLSGDVETIIGKALEKDVARRYQTVDELAEDVRRYLANEPIRARRPSASYQIRKFARRNKALVGGLSGVFLALVIGLVGTSLGFLEARRSRDAARADAERARQTATFLRDLLGGVDPAVAQGLDTALLRSILDKTRSRVDDELADFPDVEADIRSTLAKTYHAIADFEASHEQFEKALAIRERIAPDDRRAILSEKKGLAVSMTFLGEMNASGELLEEILAEAERLYGPDDDFVNFACSDLGVAYLRSHRESEAEPLFERVHAFFRARFGENDVNTLVAKNCLGLLRIDQGRYEEAETWLRAALAGRRAAQGESHPETIKAIHNLAGCYNEMGRYADAEPLFRETLERYLSVLGPDHETTLRVMKTLAKFLFETRRYEESERLHERAIELAAGRYGTDGLVTLDLRSSLGTLLRVTGRDAEALELHSSVLEALETRVGPGHPLHLSVLHEHASDLMRLGRNEQAIVPLEQLAERFEDSPEGFSWLGALNDLGLCYMEAGRYDEAERLFRKALDARLRSVGADHRSTIICYSSLGLLALRRERWDESLEWLERSFVKTIDLFGDDQPDVVRAAAYLVDLLPRARTLGPYEELCGALLAWQRRTGTAGQDAIGMTLAWLGSALIENGKCDAAEPLLVEAIETLTEAYGDLHPRVATAVGAYGRALLCLGRADEAEPLLEQAWEDLGGEPRERRAVARALARLLTERGDATGAAVWQARGA